MEHQRCSQLCPNDLYVLMFSFNPKTGIIVTEVGFFSICLENTDFYWSRNGRQEFQNNDGDKKKSSGTYEY